jgi:alkylhydroperoxidase family enzyme
MSLIRTIDEQDAEGALRQLYDRLSGPDGKVANILKVQSLSPATLDTHYAFYRTLMFGRSPLSRPERELIAVVVSDVNRCHY